MYSVYQHWDPLKTCIVGKSYPPEFYSWIKNPKTRLIFGRIAEETEEDFQSLIKILESFDVEVLRPDIPEDFSLLFDNKTNSYVPPPMTPRDYFGMYGNTFTIDKKMSVNNIYQEYYNNIKDPSWPNYTVTTLKDLKSMPTYIVNELYNNFGLADVHYQENGHIDDITGYNPIFFKEVLTAISKNASVKFIDTSLNTASTSRIGKDIYTGMYNKVDNVKKIIGDDYRVTVMPMEGHLDGNFCPVVPGLIISLNDIPTYKDTFPGWEVVYLPDQSWDKVRPFIDLKKKNKGKWWIPGEEYNDDVIETVDTWMSKWVGYVEETVFDVNMLVINEKNVVVNNYNKAVFDALERYGVTPHICNFRHRYFWDGGLHCITSDLDREGSMNDYFPERN
jgi:glycine amidinotransferase